MGGAQEPASLDFQSSGAWLVRTETAAVVALWSRAWPDAGSEDVVIEIGDVGCPPIRDVEQRIGRCGTQLRWTAK